MRIYLVYDKSHHDILREEGCNLMITYASLRGGIDAKLPKGFSSVMIDSGGFQQQTGTEKVGITPIFLNHKSYPRDFYKPLEWVRSYAFWLQRSLEKYPGIIDGYLNLDIMNNTNQTLENQAYMESEGLNPIPVWHPGEGDRVLDYYCSEYDYVALGGLVGEGKMGRHVIKHIFQRMVQEHPKTKFHILGMGITASTALRTFRPYSVDFSTWVNVYKFGHGLVWDKDGLLREKGLPQDVRDRIRVDKEFKSKLVREAIQKIKIYGERIEQMNDPHQIQMDWRV